MKKSGRALACAIAVATSTLPPSTHAGLDIGKAHGAAVDAGKAATLSDADVRAMSMQFRDASDRRNKVAPVSSKYAQRLALVTRGLESEDGLRLNFKAYLAPTVNAFALGDGTVRVYSGLMDLMTDDELHFVLGHEIGHVKLGHGKKAIQTAYAASAARQGIAANSGGRAGTAAKIADSDLGEMLEKVVNAQHSQGQESDADAYGVGFLKRHRFDVKAAPSALRKLARGGAESTSILSSHPAPGERAKAVEKMAGA